MSRLPVATALSLALLSACASPPGTPIDPAEARAQAEEQRALETRQRDFRAVLVRLDQMLDSYVNAVNHRGQPRADEQAEQLEKAIHDTALDITRVSTAGVVGYSVVEGANFRRLLAQGADGTDPYYQGVALAALGFTGKAEVLPDILQGAMLDDPQVADKATLGLAVLRNPKTPPGVLAAIIENPKHPEDGRVNAAWALYCIQGAMPDPSGVITLWRRYLPESDRLPVGVLVQAIRGLGLNRDAQDGPLVAPFLQHVTPKVRSTAALALGRMNAQQHWRELLDLLGPREANQNVRLDARKALQALAGNVDYGYDVAAWRKVFEREQ